jgi:hypothetical protein
MKNTMKKGIMLLALALLIAGGAFAQSVGDTYTLAGQTYVVESVSGDRVTLRKGPTLDGVWRIRGDVEDITFSGSSFTYISPRRSYGPIWKSAIDKGFVKFGSTQAFRNLRKTGDLTWTGEVIRVQGSGSNATGITYVNTTITLSADGKSFSADGNTWNRQ